MSFAQVLKRAISNQKPNNSSNVTIPTRQVLPVVKKGIPSQRQKIAKNCCDPAMALTSTQPLKTYKTAAPKVSADTSLPCRNRFQILAVDSVVESSDTTVAHSNRAQINKAKSEVLNSNCLQASKNEIGPKRSKTETNEYQETDSFTKYDIPIITKSKIHNYKSALPHCATLKLWDVQNKHKFGFIPLGDLLLPKYVRPREGGGDSISMHYCIKNSDEHNFMGKQITLKSQLNPDAWDAHLQDYWDRQFPF